MTSKHFAFNLFTKVNKMKRNALLAIIAEWIGDVFMLCSSSINLIHGIYTINNRKEDEIALQSGRDGFVFAGGLLFVVCDCFILS